MGCAGWFPAAERGELGAENRPGEGGEMSIGEEPPDFAPSCGTVKEAKQERAAGMRLGAARVTAQSASQKAWGTWAKVGEVPWEADWAPSMAIMVSLMTGCSNSGTAAARLSTCSWVIEGEGTAQRMASNSSWGLFVPLGRVDGEPHVTLRSIHGRLDVRTIKQGGREDARRYLCKVVLTRSSTSRWWWYGKKREWLCGVLQFEMRREHRCKSNSDSVCVILAYK
jgi:hypothetical protein